jgi:hypothetical protein
MGQEKLVHEDTFFVRLIKDDERRSRRVSTSIDSVS